MKTMTKCFNVAVENNDDMEAEGPYSIHISGQTPVNAEFSPEMKTDSVGWTKEEDKAVFKDIQEVHQSYQCVQPVEERPWRKSGADITDYFNYGFDEESWKAYCRKHAKLQTFQSQHIARVTREQARYEEERSRPSSTSGRSSKKSGRQRKANSTGSGLKAGSSSRSRKKARPCCSDAARDTQVVAGISHKEKNATNYDLPRSINVCTVFSFVPPPSSLFQFNQSMSSTSMLGSCKLGNFDEPSTSLNPYFVGNMATDSAVIDAANAWECYIQQNRDRDRDRSRAHGHDKRRRRCRDRGKQSSSSSHNSEIKQMKHRDSSEHVYKRRRNDGATGKKKQKEEKDGSQKPSQSRISNFSGKDDRKKRRSQKKGKDVGRPRKATLPAKKDN